MTKKRIYRYDNVKALLIFLVVIGHMTTDYVSDSHMVRWITLWIYTFHMPAFIFVSGIVHKQYITEERAAMGVKGETRLRTDKVIGFFLCGYGLKIFLQITRTMMGQNPQWHTFAEPGIPWYLFVMAEYELLFYVIRLIDSGKTVPGKRRLEPWMVIAAGFAVSAVIGYFPAVGDTLCLSRMINFMPIYALGYYMDMKKFNSLLNGHGYRSEVPAAEASVALKESEIRIAGSASKTADVRNAGDISKAAEIRTAGENSKEAAAASYADSRGKNTCSTEKPVNAGITPAETSGDPSKATDNLIADADSKASSISTAGNGGMATDAASGAKMNLSLLALRITSCAVIIASLCICYFGKWGLYSWRKWFTGRRSYEFLQDYFSYAIKSGWWIRLAVWAFAIALTLAIIALMPDKDLGFITVIGARTLNVYFWHRPLCYLFRNWMLLPRLVMLFGGTYQPGLGKGLALGGGTLSVAAGFAAYCLVGAAMTALFSLKAFEHPASDLLKLGAKIAAKPAPNRPKGSKL